MCFFVDFVFFLWFYCEILISESPSYRSGQLGEILVEKIICNVLKKKVQLNNFYMRFTNYPLLINTSTY